MRCFLKNVCPQEELASWECEILIATLKVHSQNGANWFSTKSVTEAFNTEKPEREKVKTMTIGKQIRQFGFRPHRSAHRKGWRWDEKLVIKLKERYPIAKSAVSAESALTQDISQCNNPSSDDIPSETAQMAQTASPEYIEKLEKELKQKGYNYKIHRGQEN